MFAKNPVCTVEHQTNKLKVMPQNKRPLTAKRHLIRYENAKSVTMQISLSLSTIKTAEVDNMEINILVDGQPANVTDTTGTLYMYKPSVQNICNIFNRLDQYHVCNGNEVEEYKQKRYVCLLYIMQIHILVIVLLSVQLQHAIVALK